MATKDVAIANWVSETRDKGDDIREMVLSLMGTISTLESIDVAFAACRVKRDKSIG